MHVRRWGRMVGAWLAVGVLTGCVATTTQLAPVTRAEIQAEEDLERQLVLRTTGAQQRRLDALAFPLMTAAAPLCAEAAQGRLGLRFGVAGEYEGEWRAAAERALGLSDTVQVLGVVDSGPAARAGARPGDRVLQVGDSLIPAGRTALARTQRAVRSYKTRQLTPVSLRVLRDGALQELTVLPEVGCDYPTTVMIDDALNAYADGEQIYVTSTMMRFAEDAELRTILGHELAHNAMGHIKAKKKNALFGAILGALADVAITASTGVSTRAAYANQGAQWGTVSFSQDFEREADYVGLYALALAGVELQEAPTFWRHLAQASPDAIGLAFSHPTTAERFVRMEKAIAEIREKQAGDRPLRPKLKGEMSAAAGTTTTKR